MRILIGAKQNSIHTASWVKQLAGPGHEVLLFHVVAPEEEEFPFARPTQFRNLEIAGHRKLVDPHQLRQHYLEQYNEFCSELVRRCRSVGVDYQKIRTDEPYHIALGAFLDSRTRRKGKAK